ncbi:NYN domain-containing protein [Aeromonas caviae]|uniref:NYN domain-containing protein n=1 Tax=Aeromonas caviae TaxID=648 RepID=UPI0038CF6D6E
MTLPLNYTYVDNSNFYYEGRRASAVSKQLPGAETYISAMNNKVMDQDWEADYGKLHSFVCGDSSEIGCAKLWGSPPPSDTFWKMVERKGFEVKTYEKNFAGKEKKVDVAIAHQITKDAYSGKVRKGIDEITLVAGDKDFVPVVTDLVENGHIVHVVFWDNAAPELVQSCSKFTSLNQYLGHLTR